MSGFVPKKEHFREVLLHYFLLKKSAAEVHRIFLEIYGNNAPSEATCRNWFRRFKNNDFDVEDKERPGGPKKFKDEELEALINKDQSQTQEELAEILGVTRQAVSVRLKHKGIVQTNNKRIKN